MVLLTDARPVRDGSMKMSTLGLDWEHIGVDMGMGMGMGTGR